MNSVRLSSFSLVLCNANYTILYRLWQKCFLYQERFLATFTLELPKIILIGAAAP